MKEKKEVERLKALRDRQLKARDPLVKQRKIQKQVSKKYILHANKQNPMKTIWSDLSHKWKGALYGLILGLLIFLIISNFFLDKIDVLIAALIIPVLMVIGILFGAGFDWREDLKDF